MKLKSMLLASLALSACGAPQTSRLEDRVDPAELRGTVLVRKPTDITLPDCNSSHSGYSNSTFRITKSGTTIASGAIGSSVQVPEGNYYLVINETYAPITVKRQTTLDIKAGRAEVSDVNGTRVIYGPNVSGYSYALNRLATGCGVTLAPNKFRLEVTYQSHTVNYDVDLTD